MGLSGGQSLGAQCLWEAEGESVGKARPGWMGNGVETPPVQRAAMVRKWSPVSPPVSEELTASEGKASTHVACQESKGKGHSYPQNSSIGT